MKLCVMKNAIIRTLFLVDFEEGGGAFVSDQVSGQTLAIRTNDSVEPGKVAEICLWSRPFLADEVKEYYLGTIAKHK